MITGCPQFGESISAFGPVLSLLPDEKVAASGDVHGPVRRGRTGRRRVHVSIQAGGGLEHLFGRDRRLDGELGVRASRDDVDRCRNVDRPVNFQHLDADDPETLDFEAQADGESIAVIESGSAYRAPRCADHRAERGIQG